MTVTFSIEYWAQPHERLTLVQAELPTAPPTLSADLSPAASGRVHADHTLRHLTYTLHSYRLTDETGAVLREEWRIPPRTSSPRW